LANFSVKTPFSANVEINCFTENLCKHLPGGFQPRQHNRWVTGFLAHEFAAPDSRPILGRFLLPFNSTAHR
jgi:hypothetical protein